MGCVGSFQLPPPQPHTAVPSHPEGAPIGHNGCTIEAGRAIRFVGSGDGVGEEKGWVVRKGTCTNEDGGIPHATARYERVPSQSAHPSPGEQ